MSIFKKAIGQVDGWTAALGQHHAHLGGRWVWPSRSAREQDWRKYPYNWTKHCEPPVPGKSLLVLAA